MRIGLWMEVSLTSDQKFKWYAPPISLRERVARLSTNLLDAGDYIKRRYWEARGENFLNLDELDLSMRELSLVTTRDDMALYRNTTGMMDGGWLPAVEVGHRFPQDGYFALTGAIAVTHGDLARDELRRLAGELFRRYSCPTLLPGPSLSGPCCLRERCGLFCTLPHGHDGNHVAHAENIPIHSWPERGD